MCIHRDQDFAGEQPMMHEPWHRSSSRRSNEWHDIYLGSRMKIYSSSFTGSARDENSDNCYHVTSSFLRLSKVAFAVETEQKVKEGVLSRTPIPGAGQRSYTGCWKPKGKRIAVSATSGIKTSHDALRAR